MQSLFQPGSASIGSHVEEAAFDLLNLRLPDWYINPCLRVALKDKTSWDDIATQYPLSVAPGMEAVLASSTPPPINYFSGLPCPGEPSWLSDKNVWGVYVLVFKHDDDDQPDKIYIGSGTERNSSIVTRLASYKKGTDYSSGCRKAISNGYKHHSTGILCWMDLPTFDLVPQCRARILVLEAVYTIIFCACNKSIMDEVFIPDFFPWKREAMSWQALCTHLSLSDRFRGSEQLIFSIEEREEARQQCLNRAATRQQRYRKRKREEDEEGYLRKGVEQHQGWSAKNPGRVDEISAGVRKRARESQRFRCEDCNHDFASDRHLQEHLKSDKHAYQVKHGQPREVIVTDKLANLRATRAANVANKTYYCAPCDKACINATDLKRHCSRQKHLDKVAATSHN